MKGILSIIIKPLNNIKLWGSLRFYSIYTLNWARENSILYILFHLFNVRILFSLAICCYLSVLEERVRGSQITQSQITQSHFSCPWQPTAFVKLSPLHLTYPLPPCSSVRSLLFFLKSPPPFVTNTTTIYMSNPLESAQGSQYGANRFSAFTVQLLRQEKQTQLKL